MKNRIALTGVIVMFAVGCVERQGDRIILSGEGYEAAFSAQDGSILSLSDKVAQLSSAVNRSLPRGAHDPGHVTLVAGDREDFVGGYRLDG